MSAFGFVLARIFGNCQPDPVARLLRSLCTASFRVGWCLVTYRNPGQVGTFLYIECQSFWSFRPR